jgi:hypothetical protein
VHGPTVGAAPKRPRAVVVVDAGCTAKKQVHLLLS